MMANEVSPDSWNLALFDYNAKKYTGATYVEKMDQNGGVLLWKKINL